MCNNIMYIFNLPMMKCIGITFWGTNFWRSHFGADFLGAGAASEPLLCQEPEPEPPVGAGAGAGSRSRQNRAAPQHCP